LGFDAAQTPRGRLVCPTHALGLLSTQVDSPSIQGWADQASGGWSLGRDQMAWPRCPQPRGVRLQPDIWDLLVATSQCNLQ